MSSQEITEDTGGIKRKVEQQSPVTLQWSAKGTNEAVKISRLRRTCIETTTQAFEPGGEDAQDESLPVAKPSYPYPVEHSDTRERLTMSSLDNIMYGEETLT